MQENNNSSNTEQEKGFALVRTDTIQLWVWLQGYRPLDEQPLKSVSEDISYRIRETSDCAVNFMRHCKRSKLKTSDFNQAFQLCNIERNFGNTSTKTLKYNIVNTSDASDKVLKCFRTKLFELDDDIIALKLPDDTIDQRKIAIKANRHLKGKILNGKWIIVNGNSTQLDPKEFLENSDFNLEEEDFINSAYDIETDLFYTPPLTEPYSNYYDMITKIILIQYETSDVDDDVLFEKVLTSLKSDQKLQLLLPYLVNFLSKTIQTLNLVNNNEKCMNSKTNLFYLERCVETLKHLIVNRNLFLAPRGLFSRILSCLLFCTMQNTTFIKNTDGLQLRETAAYTLVLFLKLYQRFSTNIIPNLIKKSYKPHFQEISDSNKLFTTYGIISSLVNFGGQIINSLYPCILKFLKKTNDKDFKSTSHIEVLVKHQILKCFVIYFNWFLKKTLIKINSNNSSYFTYNKILVIYKEIYEEYGDSFSNQLIESRVFESLLSSFKLNSCKANNDKNVIEFVISNKKRSFRQILLVKSDRNLNDKDVFEKSYMLKKNCELKINYGTQRINKTLAKHGFAGVALPVTGNNTKKNVTVEKVRFNTGNNLKDSHCLLSLETCFL